MLKFKTLTAVAALGLSTAASAQVVLATSTWVPPTHLLSMSQASWCADVAKATQDRVKCNILPKPVSPPPGTFDAIRDGQADLSFSVHGYTPGRYVMTGLAEFPFLGDSAVATSVAYERMYRKHLVQFNEHRGLKVLTVFTHGPGIIFNNKKPVKSLADLDGIKFRVGGGIVNEIGKAIGANMTLRPASQAYEMLSSGVMDGNWFPDESVVSFKLEKLTKHRTALPGGAYNTSFAFVMNEATWNKISKADQDAIEKLSGEAAARRFGMSWDDVDAKSRDVQRQNGVTFDNADAKFVADYKAKTAPLEADWIKKAEEKGLKNAAAVLTEFRAEIAKIK
jgi:TRAP-type C4-dicarboxylate transport system substrate-binding protein